VFFAFPSVLLQSPSAAHWRRAVQHHLSLRWSSCRYHPVAETVTTSCASSTTSRRRAQRASSFNHRARARAAQRARPIFVYATGLISVSDDPGRRLSFLGIGTKPPDAEWG